MGVVIQFSDTHKKSSRAPKPGMHARTRPLHVALRMHCPRTVHAHILGANYGTPEIDTSENIVDVQWHVPMDVHLSVVCFKGL